MHAENVKSILIRAAIIIALGTGIGVADSMFRPIQVGREAPPALELPKPKPAEAEPKPPVAPPPQATSKPNPPAGSPKTPATSASVPSPNDCTPTPKDKLPAGHITLDEAKALFDAKDTANPPETGGPGAVFVDTRKKETFEEGHVAGSYRISLHDFDNGDPQVLNFIERSAVIITYCVGGNCDESEAVARNLSMAGYKKVYVMHDGFPCWHARHYPSEVGPGAFP